MTTQDYDLLIRAAIFWVCGGFGMLFHYAKLVHTSRSTSTAVEYFLHFNFLATMSACGALFFTLSGYLVSGALLEVSIPTLLAMAFTAGYSTDSMLNSDEPRK